MSNTNSQIEEFGPIRKAIWPIYNYELKKFVPLGLIMFCILFVYTLLRDTKDTLMVTSAVTGAGVISFLKVWFVTPSAVLFVIYYSKLTNILSREKVFYAVVTPFIVFFGLFAFIINPNLDLLHPSAEFVAFLHAQYPSLSGFIDVFALWSYSLFYVLSEIWGSAMIALMFWQFANQIVRMNDSKRFYGLFVVIGNVALIFSGQAVKFCSESIKSFYSGTEEEVWQVSLYLLMGSVVIMGSLAMYIYRWMYVNVLTDPKYYDGANAAPKKKKQKPGLKESIKIILASPELGLIAMLIMAYGVTINLVEVQWKQQLNIYFAGNKGAYNGFMGDYSTWTGIATILFSLLIGSRILRVLSWFKAAIITPAFICIGGALFFLFILSADWEAIKPFVAHMLSIIGTSPVTAAAFLGAGVVLMSKAVKYCLFDPTKEMAYIPLDEELKTKGKAAVDVIGGRAGKAGGAFVQSMLIMIMATKDVVVIAPICFATFVGVCLIWFVSVKLLNKRINKAIAKTNTVSEDNIADDKSTAEPVTA
jgi:AAA family ATP:ADP antiporter